MQPVHSELSERPMDCSTVLERRNSLNAQKESNVDHQKTLVSFNEPNSANYIKIKSGFGWKAFQCCLSATFLQGLIIGLLTAGLILALVTPFWLTSVFQTSTTKTINIDILSIMNTASVTTTATVTTSVGTTTTSNICTSGVTYAIQLLYLSLNSSLSWTKYSFNYTAPNIDSATLMFTMRNDPSYWYLDEVSITNSSGSELLSNGDFGQGSLSNWTYCNPTQAPAAGQITSSDYHNGSYSYQDGSVGASDYLSQTFTVIPNHIYSISFWLYAPSANGPNFVLVTVSS